MKLLAINNYQKAFQYINPKCIGAVYPYSIAEQIQNGEVYLCGSAALFWHQCGFAFVYGDCEDAFLDQIYDRFLRDNLHSGKRFILFSADENIEMFFSHKSQLLLDKRYFYAYQGNPASATRFLPDGFHISQITNAHLKQIQGNVTPQLFWDSTSAFLQKGKGFCILDGTTIAAWAFSAAVSSHEIDIGVETRSEYRNLGLATIAAEKMIQYCIQQHKRPVWACHARNIGSQTLAEKLGFVRIADSVVIKKNL